MSAAARVTDKMNLALTHYYDKQRRGRLNGLVMMLALKRKEKLDAKGKGKTGEVEGAGA
jgi:hypothetical protein